MRRFVFAVLVTAVAFAGNAADYELTDLGQGVTPMAINSAAVVVGRWTVTSGTSSHRHPFVWQDGVMTDLLPAGWSDGEARDVNSAGEIVGALYGSSPLHGVKWVNGTVVTTFSSRYGADFSGIDDSGRIVGSGLETLPPGMHVVPFNPLLFDHGTARWLPVQIGGGNATKINANGLIIGNVITSFVPPDRFYPSAAAWKDGQLTVLPMLGPGMGSASAVNSSDVIVGTTPTGAVINGFPESQPAKWVGGVISTLGSLGGVFGGATGINSSGQIVGYSDAGNLSPRAFFYENGLMSNLNDAVDGALGWTLTQASGINDDGVIIGTGLPPGATNAQAHGFVLTPADPATMMRHLQDAIAAAGIDAGMANSLASKVAGAQDALARGNTRAACNQLAACQNELDAQAGKKLSTEIASQLRGRVDRIRRALGC